MREYRIAPQIFVAITAYGGAFIFGILLGWSSPAAPRLLDNDKNSFNVTKNEFSWIVAAMAIGAGMATLVSGVLRNIFGTKLTILIAAIPSALGWLLIIFAQNSEMLIAGRFFGGFAAGSYGILLPLYIGEIASKEIRGSLLSLFQIALNFGEVFVFALGYFASFAVLNIVCGVIPLVYSAAFMKLPESPVFLIGQQKQESAKNSMNVLRGKKYDSSDELNEITEYHKTNTTKQSILDHLKHRPTRKAFFIISAQFFFFQFTGINAILFYTSTILKSAQIDLDPGLGAIIVVSSQTVGTSLSLLLVDRFGRRPLLMISTTVMALSHIGIGTFFSLKDSGASVDSLGWLPIASMSIFEVAFGCGIGPVSYVLLGELFNSNAKRAIAPIGKSLNLFFAAAIGLIFPYLVDSIGTAPTFFLFFGFSILALIFTIFCIPETKGRSLLEIQTLLG